MIFNPFPKKALVVFTCLQYKSSVKTVGKGEIARNERFCFFSTTFSSRLKNFVTISSNSKLSSANSSSLEESNIGRLGKG